MHTHHATRFLPVVACAMLSVFIVCRAPGKTYYVSPAGSDTAAGTIDHPFLTLAKAVGLSALVPGDTIWLRAGTYPASSTVKITKSGMADARYYVLNYPGERPLLDFSGEPRNTSTARGIELSGSYWTIRGIDIAYAGDNGMYLTGSNDVLDFCTFSENQDTGLQLDKGASNNQIINCDSYYNADASQGNADGFSPKLAVGTGNSFVGCRAWQNSDDGWDGYLRPSNNVSTTLVNCWSFRNGYLKSGVAGSGNGNGFKMGGGDTSNIQKLMHNMSLTGCVAFGNLAKGFDQNHDRGSMILLNCTSFRNGAANYGMNEFINADSGKVMELANCVSVDGTAAILASAVQLTNSWMGTGADTTDFLSVDMTPLTSARKPDGSLPDVTFLHLAAGSHLIDAGTYVGLPFDGAAPDLGAFEYHPASSVASARGEVPAAFRLSPAFPNPFNPSTTVTYVLPHAGPVTVRVYDMLGRLVRELSQGLQPAGEGRVVWDGKDAVGRSASSGSYAVRVTFDGLVRTDKVMVLR